MWHLIRAVLLSSCSIIWSYFRHILPYSKHPEKAPLEKRYRDIKKLIHKVNKNLKMDLHVEGLENIPDTVSCYYGNHLSAADPLPYFDIFDQPIAFLGKIEIMKMPFAGKALKAAGGKFLDRSNLKQQLKVMLSVQDSLAKKECNWFVFPEGTRNKDQMAKLRTFQHGAFRSAMKAKAPIVPVVNYGTFRLLSSKHSFKKYPTFVKFLKPIYPYEYENLSTEEVAKKVESMIQKEISFNMRRIDLEYMNKYNKKKYRFNQIF